MLLFEVLAPLWLALPLTRTPAIGFALTMHAFVGTCFWPVRWFAMLMASLLLGAFLPESSLDWISSRVRHPRAADG